MVQIDNDAIIQRSYSKTIFYCLMVLLLCAVLVPFTIISPALAQESPQPGSACTAGETGQYVQIGGPEETGGGYFLTCDGSTWKQIFGYQPDGTSLFTFINQVACDDGENITYDKETGALSCGVYDITPDAFNFIDESGLTLTKLETSNTVTITGIGDGTPVSISGQGSPKFRINSGSWVTSGYINSGQTLQLQATTSASFNTAHTITVTVGDASDDWTITTYPEDLIPNAFTFTDQSDVLRNTLITSNTLTISGINSNPNVSVSGSGSPQISIDGGAWVTSGTITNGQTLQVRTTSSSDWSTAHNITVTVGTVSDTWSVTTLDQDLVPDAFSFTDLNNQELNTLLSSNTITINGINDTTNVSVSGSGSPQISIDGGAWGTSGTIENGQTLQVRLTSANASSTARSATIDVGGITDIWSVTTKDITPAAFDFTNISAQTINTWTTSNIETITGIYDNVPVSITGNGYFSINGGGWTTSGILSNGQTLQLRILSSSSFSTAVTTSVTVGDVSDAWSVTTEPQDTLPNIFSFNDLTIQEFDTLLSSNTITINGINDSTSVSVSGDGSPQISINGGAWGTSGTITNGQTLQVRLTSGNDSAVTRSALVDVGGVTDSWDVTTKDIEADNLSFTDLTDQTINTTLTSESITLAGINASADVSISGSSGQISIDGGAWVTSGTITNGQTLQIRLTTGSSFSTDYQTTVTLGTGSTTWTVATEAQDTTPDAFSFNDETLRPFNTLRSSNLETITGINASTAVSVSGDGSPQISIDGGAWGTSGTIENGQTLQVRLTTANASLTTYSALVDVGGVTDSWDVTTKDLTPDAFDFTNLAGQARSTQVTSNSLTITGISNSAEVSISGSGAEISIEGGAWVTSGTINNGETLQLRLTTGSNFSTDYDTTVTVGTSSDLWRVTTENQDTLPDAFTFTDVTNQDFVTQIESNTITISGINDSTPVSVSGDGAPEISIDGGAWAASGSITNGQTLQVRLTSSPDSATSRSALVDVGGVTDAWSVSTYDITPAAFDFTNQTNQARSTWIWSTMQTITGISASATVSVTNGAQFRIDEGSWVTSGTITNGQTLRLRITSSASWSTAVSTTVTVGTVSDAWSVTTEARDVTPASCSFTDLTMQPYNSLRESADLTVSGINDGAAVSISGDGSPQISIADGSWTTSGTITNGQKLEVRLTSANAASTTRTANITVGTCTSTWDVTTYDITPAAFNFTNVTGANPSTWTSSNTVTISGINTATPVSISSGGQMNINGAGFTAATSGTISNGQSLQIRLKTSSAMNTASSVTVNVGGRTDAWSVTTIAYTYSWYESGWGSCGGAYSTYDDSYCANPPTNYGGCVCAATACVSAFASCYKPCNNEANGTKTQTVYCERSDGTQVADSYCSGAGTKPASSAPCVRGCDYNGDKSASYQCFGAALDQACSTHFYCKDHWPP